MLAVTQSRATVFYVDANSATPAPPFANWASASATIQDAVDAAADGDLILVTNGVYQTGGRVVYGALTNRVVINKAVTVQSVNGPAVTIIQGNPVTDDTAIRCAYLTNNAVLSGFTLTQGATRSNGDGTQEQSGGGVWCESASAVLSNCVLNANLAVGAGGGVYSGTLNGCIVSSNSVGQYWSGGGGGASSATLNNCLIYGNSAGYAGGGADSSTLMNCTVVFNGAYGGGGVNACLVYNCIVYYNSAGYYGNNFTSGELDYCCTTPDPSIPDGYHTGFDGYVGTNNIVADPLFVDMTGGNFHLQTDSPCVNAGNDSYAPPGPDLDGNSRIVGDVVDIGVYELPTAVPFSATVQPDATNAVAGFPLNFTGLTVGGP